MDEENTASQDLGEDDIIDADDDDNLENSVGKALPQRVKDAIFECSGIKMDKNHHKSLETEI